MVVTQFAASDNAQCYIRSFDHLPEFQCSGISPTTADGS